LFRLSRISITCTLISTYRRLLSKDEGKQAKDAFTQAFEKNKKTKLFNGQRELYTAWGRLSETGAHATPLALVNRFKIHEDSNNIYYRLNYTGIGFPRQTGV
jgi:hypothetical protein